MIESWSKDNFALRRYILGHPKRPRYFKSFTLREILLIYNYEYNFMQWSWFSYPIKQLCKANFLKTNNFLYVSLIYQTNDTQHPLP